MCGIVGLVTQCHTGGLAEIVETMSSKLVHRGPDSHGIWTDEFNGIGLGHRRLAILDLSAAGHQPMASGDNRYQVTFNGEIYNFKELRSRLEPKGYEFIGHSDTEVLLVAIQEWGFEQALTELQGMFAIALWDAREKTLSLARDRMGEKPLFYGWVGERFVFASELSAIEALEQGLKIDRQSLAAYFSYGYVPAPQSIYQNIHKLVPGSFLCLSIAGHTVVSEGFSPYPGKGALSPKLFWDLESVVTDGADQKLTSVDKAVDELDGLLQQVISQQSIADVPLGAFISGGVDSSTVAAVMQHVNSRPVNTFTIGFSDPEYNEAEFAKTIARHLGTNHTELYIDGRDCLELAPQLANIYDEPIADSSQIPTYLVSRMARQDVTVCLSGDGGDELFAGYNRYGLTESTWNKVGVLPYPVRALMAELIAVVPSTWWNNVYQAVHGVFGSADSRQNNVGLKIQKLSALLRCNDIVGAYKLLISYWQAPFLPLRDGVSVRETVLDQVPPVVLDEFVDRAMYWDQLTYLPGDNLTKVDRASMASSLETRLPLLHHKIVEFAWRVPLSMKLRENKNKWLLRQVLYRYVPEQMIERPKMGFSVPVAGWLRGPLQGWAEALLSDADSDVFDTVLIEKRWRKHQSGERDHSNQLWAILMFLDWYRARSAGF
jgi:asparagine synthase (glutamine-hydrolysing)